MESVKSTIGKTNNSLDSSIDDSKAFAAVVGMGIISENREFFEKLHLKYPSVSINNIDDYCNFIAAWKICNLERYKQLLDQDKAEFLNKLADDARPVVHSSLMDDAIKFTNNHAAKIFAPNQIGFGMRSAIADFITCSLNQNKIDDSVFECLCFYEPRLTINHFDDLDKVFDRIPDLFSKLFSSGHLLNIMPMGLTSVLDIWKREYGKEQYKDKIDNLVNELLADVESFPIEKSANILDVYSFLKAIDSFLKEIDSPEANVFPEKVKKAEDLVWEYYEGLENSINIEIDIPGFSIEKWKSESDGRSKLLSLTHRLVSVDADKAYESFLSTKPVFPNSNDISQMGADEFLNPLHQNSLSSLEFIQTNKFYAILGDQQAFAEYSSIVKSEIKFISDGLIELTDNDLENNAVFLFTMLSKVSEVAQQRSDNDGVSCYASLVYMCSCIERVLYLLYKYMSQNKQYVPENKTLGKLLDENNTYMIDLLGKEHLLSLVFFLIQTPQKKIGLNYRNYLVHWSHGMKQEQMTPLSTSKLLWLFTDVVNSAFLYFEKHNNSKRNLETSTK